MRTKWIKRCLVAWMIIICFTVRPTELQAKQGGGDPPKSVKCNGAGGGSFLSYSEGTMTDDYPIINGSGTNIYLALTYASYNASREKATINTALGFGWTHTYNTFIYIQRGHLFRHNGTGRTTKFSRIPASSPTTYLPTVGYFEKMIEEKDGTLLIEYPNGRKERYQRISKSPYFFKSPLYNLIEIVDRNQNRTILEYSEGKLSTIIDPYGRKVQFTYYAHNRIKTITDPLGRITTLYYDDLGSKLQKIEDPIGQLITYSYNVRFQLLHKIEKNGNEFFYSYKDGKPIAISDKAGNLVFSISNANNWGTNRAKLVNNLRRAYMPSTTFKTDGNGHVWKYRYNENAYITKITAPDGAITRYWYDTVCLKVIREKDARGHNTFYAYDTRGNRTQIRDHLENVTRFEYEPEFNKITQIIRSNGAITQYEYDDKGNRIKEIKDADGLRVTTEWTYDKHGNVLSIKNANGHTTAYAYDPYGNRISKTDAEGNVTAFQYDLLGNLIAHIKGDGAKTTFEYDPLNRLVKETGPLSFTKTYVYDANNNVVEIQTMVSYTPLVYQKKQFAYDRRSRLVRVTIDPDHLNLVTGLAYDGNNNLTWEIKPGNRTLHYTYDVHNRLISTTDPLGRIDRFVYDKAGNLVGEIDANQHVKVLEYDPLNRLITEIYKMGPADLTAANNNDIITRYTYQVGSPNCQSCGNPSPDSSQIATKIDANAKITHYRYDKLDRLIKTIKKVGDAGDDADANDWVETLVYDPMGNAISETDANGNISTWAFDKNNQLRSYTNALGESTLRTYNAIKQLASLTDPGGNTTNYIYNKKGELSTVSDPLGIMYAWTYDGLGNQITETDGVGNIYLKAFDAANRLVSQTDPIGESTFYKYDDAGNMIRSTDREGHLIRYQYDQLNQMTHEIVELDSPDPEIPHDNYISTQTKYDAVGNIVRLTDAKGNSTHYAYDELDRLIKETYANKTSRRYTYDAADNLTQRIDQNGQVTNYEYNDLHYLLKKDYASDPDIIFSYDTKGQLLSATRDTWIITNEYDATGRITKSTQNGQHITYTYNAKKRTRSIKYPSGRLIVEQFDPRQRLETIAEGRKKLTQYTYDGANRALTRSYNNGTVASYAYDPNGNLIQLEYKKKTLLQTGFAYAYDKEGHKLYESNLHHASHSQQFDYDNAYRLTGFKTGELLDGSITEPQNQSSYSLDKLANWENKSCNGLEENRTHNEVNQIVSIGDDSLFYDKNGNLIRDQNFNYSYNQENRLVEVKNLNNDLVSNYQYDALGRRVSKQVYTSVQPEKIAYYYDGDRVIEEHSNTSTQATTYVYGNYIDEVLSMDQGKERFYYQQNSQWSVVAIGNRKGLVLERYAYDVYGKQKVMGQDSKPIARTQIQQEYGFTGRPLDDETSLWYFRARYYSAALGRFQEADPLSYVDGLNLYSSYFIPNDVDPSGYGVFKGPLGWIMDYVPGLGLDAFIPPLNPEFGDAENPLYYDWVPEDPWDDNPNGSPDPEWVPEDPWDDNPNGSPDPGC